MRKRRGDIAHHFIDQADIISGKEGIGAVLSGNRTVDSFDKFHHRLDILSVGKIDATHHAQEIRRAGKSIIDCFQLQGICFPAGMQQGVSVGDDHHLHPFLGRIYIIVKSLFIVLIRIFVIVDHIVGLTDLKIKIGILPVFFQFLK